MNKVKTNQVSKGKKIEIQYKIYYGKKISGRAIEYPINSVKDIDFRPIEKNAKEMFKILNEN